MKKKLSTLSLLALFLFPTVANANVIWPSIVIAQGLRSYDVILLGLLIEIIFIKCFEKQSWLRCGLIGVIMNLVSTLVGIILIPAVGFLGTLALGLLSEIIPALGNTFDTPVWIFSYILTILANAVIEGLTVRYSAKIPFKKTFWWLLCANTLSVVACILMYGFTLDSFMM